jgi:hypothetical protein
MHKNSRRCGSLLKILNCRSEVGHQVSTDS